MHETWCQAKTCKKLEILFIEFWTLLWLFDKWHCCSNCLPFLQTPFFQTHTLSYFSWWIVPVCLIDEWIIFIFGCQHLTPDRMKCGSKRFTSAHIVTVCHQLWNFWMHLHRRSKHPRNSVHMMFYTSLIQHIECLHQMFYTTQQYNIIRSNLMFYTVLRHG